MSQKWRKYSPEFRRDALEKACANVTQLARELGIRRKWLCQWKTDAAGGQAAAPVEAQSKGDSKVKELGSAARPAELGVGFFQRCLAAHRGTTLEERRDFRAGVTKLSSKSTNAL
jgi:transposase-like protein